jgi:aspartate/methionine/tyrosine aminotransferase
MPPRTLSNRVINMKPSGVRKFFSLAASMDACIDLSIGQPDFEVFPELKNAACEAIKLNANSYTQSVGLVPAREAIRSKYHLDANSSHDVIITSGVMGGLFLSFASLLDPGDEILIPDPYFVGYKEAAHLLGAVPVFFDTYPDFSFSAEKVEPLITDKTKALVISSPSNPTGYVLSGAEIRELEDFCQTYGLYLVYDEIYETFSYDSVHQRPVLRDTTIILNGLSKSHAATGWRTGWALASRALIEQFEKVQQFTYVCAPAPFQSIVPEALHSETQQILAAYRSKRNRVFDVLSGLMEILKPGGAFYFFPPVSGKTASEFSEELIQKKLLVIPGSVFSKQDTNFRLSYAVPDKVLDQALEILTQELG